MWLNAPDAQAPHKARLLAESKDDETMPVHVVGSGYNLPAQPMPPPASYCGPATRCIPCLPQARQRKPTCYIDSHAHSCAQDRATGTFVYVHLGNWAGPYCRANMQSRQQLPLWTTTEAPKQGLSEQTAQHVFSHNKSTHNQAPWLAAACSTTTAGGRTASLLTPGTTRIVPVMLGADTTSLQLPSGRAMGAMASDSTLPRILPVMPDSM